MSEKTEKFRYFKDAECTVPLDNIEFAGPIEIGDQTVLNVFAKNVSPKKLADIVFESHNPDLRIEPSSTTCDPNGVIQVKFILTPTKEEKSKPE